VSDELLSFSSSKALSPVACVPTKRKLKRVKMRLKTQVLGSEAKEKFQVSRLERAIKIFSVAKRPSLVRALQVREVASPKISSNCLLQFLSV
jgi:hypothetical protein